MKKTYSACCRGSHSDNLHRRATHAGGGAQPRSSLRRHPKWRKTGVPFPASAITRSDNNVPTLYLFRNADNGFILTSADDDATPLLGYGDSPALDAEGKVPEAF